jgi:tetratricopeptide (TPR) repeat protein
MASSIRLSASVPRCFLALCLFASSAFSDPRSADAESERLSRARFTDATKAFNLSQFEAALTAYKEAYELKPLPGFLFNIAQCYRHLGHLATASFYYRRYRSEAELSSADGNVVEKLIAEVEAKQAEIERQQRVEAEAARRHELEIARAAALKAEAEEKGRALLLSSLPAPPQSDSILKKWWFWSGVAVVAGGAVYLMLPAAHPRTTSLGSVNAR